MALFPPPSPREDWKLGKCMSRRPVKEGRHGNDFSKKMRLKL